MHKLEYAIKLYVKTLLSATLKWYNAILGIANLMLVMILSVAVIRQHGDLSSAELENLANGLADMLLLVVVLPFVMTAVVLVLHKVGQRYGYDFSERELWPEVEL